MLSGTVTQLMNATIFYSMNFIKIHMKLVNKKWKSFRFTLN